ncbi:hypothetical protein KKB40_00345 [Patescibacteria group bacterium]|nr:hypothetical protein [Patescibacteria group bacterium]
MKKIIKHMKIPRPYQKAKPKEMIPKPEKNSKTCCSLRFPPPMSISSPKNFILSLLFEGA